jgi:hypothetical protein
VIHPKRSSPCVMYWCVPCRKVLYTTSYYTGWPTAIQPAFKHGKWTKKLSFHLLDLPVLNNYTLLSWVVVGKKISHKYLKLALVREMLPWAGQEQWTTRPVGRLLLTLAYWTHDTISPDQATTQLRGYDASVQQGV